MTNWETRSVVERFASDRRLHERMLKSAAPVRAVYPPVFFTAGMARAFVLEVMSDGPPEFHAHIAGRAGRAGPLQAIARLYGKVDWTSVARHFNGSVESRYRSADMRARPRRR